MYNSAVAMIRRVRLENDDLTYLFARYVARQLLSDSRSHLGAFTSAIQGLRQRNGPRPAYAEMEAAANRGARSLIKLLLDKSDDGDRIRSMAPLYAVMDQEQRRQIIASWKQSALVS